MNLVKDILGVEEEFLSWKEANREKYAGVVLQNANGRRYVRDNLGGQYFGYMTPSGEKIEPKEMLLIHLFYEELLKEGREEELFVWSKERNHPVTWLTSIKTRTPQPMNKINLKTHKGKE